MSGVSISECRTVFIPKRSGGQRRIDMPNEALLGKQRAILRVLDRIPVSPFAHGFVKGRSPITAAIPHVGKRIVVRVDIKDFFNSIKFSNWYIVVRRYLSKERHGAMCRPPHESYMAAYPRVPNCLAWFIDLVLGYCFLNTSPNSDLVLAQGFATSPALANLYLAAFDWSIARTAFKCYDANYTRYADDLIFSGPVVGGRKVPPLPAIIRQIESRLERLALQINPQKIVVMRRPDKQKVLGLVVNEKLGLDRDRRKNLRAALYQVRHGRRLDAKLQGELAHARAVERLRTEPVMSYFHYEVLNRAAGDKDIPMIAV